MNAIISDIEQLLDGEWDTDATDIRHDDEHLDDYTVVNEGGPSANPVYT